MNTKELQHHIAYMKIAETIGKLSYCVRKKVGSVLVKNNNIISTGYNGTPSGTENQCENINGETHWFTLHSESNALMKIAKSTLSSEGSILYLTLSPCKDCSKLILQAGIKEIYYLVEHSCKAGLEFLESNGIKCFNLKRNIKQLEEESGDKTKDYVINVYEEYSTIRFGKDVGFSSEWELLHSVEIDNKSEIEFSDESESLVVNEIKEPEQVYFPSFLPLPLILELMKHFQDKFIFILDDGNIKHDKNLDFFMKQSDRYYFKMIEKYVGINMWILDWFKNNTIDNLTLIGVSEKGMVPNKIYLKYNPVLNFKKEIIPPYLIPAPINLGQWKINPEYTFPTNSNLSSKEFNYQNGQLQYKPISIVYSSNNLIVHNSNYEKLIEKEIVCIPLKLFPKLINDNLNTVFGDEIMFSDLNNFIEKIDESGNYIEYTFKLDTDLKKQIFNYVVELVRQESILNIQKIDDKTLKIMK